ncbi:MAG: hypothetical protein K8963_08250, partial [Proteobacteria bacterium]|nr:hypothetical protein [Pseudomonadota bacterium]
MINRAVQVFGVARLLPAFLLVAGLTVVLTLSAVAGAEQDSALTEAIANGTPSAEAGAPPPAPPTTATGPAPPATSSAHPAPPTTATGPAPPATTSAPPAPPAPPATSSA